MDYISWDMYMCKSPLCGDGLAEVFSLGGTTLGLSHSLIKPPPSCLAGDPLASVPCLQQVRGAGEPASRRLSAQDSILPCCGLSRPPTFGWSFTSRGFCRCLFRIRYTVEIGMFWTFEIWCTEFPAACIPTTSHLSRILCLHMAFQELIKYDLNWGLGVRHVKVRCQTC